MPSPQKRASASTTDSKIDAKRAKLSSSSDAVAKTPTTVQDETAVEEPRDKPLSVEVGDLLCFKKFSKFDKNHFSKYFKSNYCIINMIRQSG